MRYIAIYDAAQAIAGRYAKKGPQLYDERMAPFLPAAEYYKQLSPQDRKKYDSEHRLVKQERIEPDKRTPEEKRADTEQQFEAIERETFTAEWLEAITGAVMRGELLAFKPVTQAPGKPADAKQAYIFLVRDADLDAWLKKTGSLYRLEGEIKSGAGFKTEVWEHADMVRDDLLSRFQREPTNPEIAKALKTRFDARPADAAGSRGRGGRMYTPENIEARLKGWRKARGHPNPSKGAK